MIKLLGIVLGSLLATDVAAATIPDTQQTVLIGYAAPFSWVLPLHALQAAQQAVSEANARNIKVDGRKLHFRLLIEDDKADPRVARFVARSFVDAGVTAVIGHWNTDTTLATAETYARANIVQITTSATAGQIFRQGYPTIFQMLGGDDDCAQAVVDYAINGLHARRIALMEDDSPFGRNLAQNYAGKIGELNGNVVIIESVSSKTSDFNAPLKRIKDADPDLILFSGSLLHSEDLVRAMKRLRVPVKLVLPGGSTSKAFIDVAGPYLTNVLTIEPGSPKEKSAGWQRFQASYRLRPNWDVSPYTIQAYDAVNMFIKGIQIANATDAQKIAAALHKMKFDGLSGRIAFDAAGARANPIYTLYQWDAGRWNPIRTYGN